MSPDSGSLAPPNAMVPQAHALGNTGHGTIHTCMHACMHPCIHPSIHTYIRYRTRGAWHTHTHVIHPFVSISIHLYQYPSSVLISFNIHPTAFLSIRSSIMSIHLYINQAIHWSIESIDPSIDPSIHQSSLIPSRLISLNPMWSWSCLVTSYQHRPSAIFQGFSPRRRHEVPEHQPSILRLLPWQMCGHGSATWHHVYWNISLFMGLIFVGGDCRFSSMTLSCRKDNDKYYHLLYKNI